MSLEPILARYESLYRDAGKPALLIVTSIRPKRRADPAEERNIFGDFDFGRPEDHRRYWDRLIDGARASLASHDGIGDDWLPGITLHYGFGAFGAAFSDAEPIFTKDTSYLPADVMRDYADAGDFRFDPNRRWSRIFRESAEYITERADSAFFFEPFPCPSPLDVANLLRGNALFTDFYEEPGALTRFLWQTAEGIVELMRHFKAGNRNRFGGAFCFGKYLTRGALLLEDAADLCSAETYERFGLRPTQAIVQAMGGGYIHHHALGRQQFGNLSRIAGLNVQQISTDPGCARPIELMGEISEAVGNRVAVEIECGAEEFIERIGEFRGGRYIVGVACEDEAQAREVTALARGLNR